MKFEKPYSQYNGKWFVRTDTDVIYYMVSGYEAIDKLSDWSRPWKIIVLAEGQDYYSPKMTVYIPQGKLRKFKPYIEEKARVLKAIFGEGWMRSE